VEAGDRVERVDVGAAIADSMLRGVPEVTVEDSRRAAIVELQRAARPPVAESVVDDARPVVDDARSVAGLVQGGVGLA
jgi:hypothetical protein